VHNLPGALRFLPAIYFDDGAENLDHFSFERFIRRHKHLAEFQSLLREFVKIYQKAHNQGCVRDSVPPAELLAGFGLSIS
jgi:hypothetical protein